MQFDLNNKHILITGGTGSLGRIILRQILRDFPRIKFISIFSRDEYKQSQLQRKYRALDNLKFIIGDVRDKERLIEACKNVDLVIHAAAMKCLDVCENNPEETFKTNVEGTKNLIAAASANNIQKVIFISSDKAVAPISIYGESKMKGESLILDTSKSADSSNFTILRLGNIFKSRGSVFKVFKEQSKKIGTLNIYDKKSTRFLINDDQLYKSLLMSLSPIFNGVIIIPKLPVFKVTDLAKAYCPTCDTIELPLRKGEKACEDLFSISEIDCCFEDKDFFYLIQNESKKIELTKSLSLAKTKANTLERSSATAKTLTFEELKQLLFKKKEAKKLIYS